MNRILRMVCTAVVAAVMFSACAKDVSVSYLEREGQSLHEWIKINRPELLGNYQSVGDYYVDVLDLGSVDAEPINDTTTWVRFTFTGRNLSGDIVTTRNEVDAMQVGSYTPFTHYVPLFQFYAGDDNIALLEGTYLSMHNTLTLGKEYAEQRGYPQQVLMRYGTKVTLYMPSSVVGSDGLIGTGGYGGQGGYELRAGMPLIVTMEITDTVRNPLKRETESLNNFVVENGGLQPPLPKPKLAADSRQLPPIILPVWKYAADSIPEIYVNPLYTPTTIFKFSQVYSSVYGPYANFAALEQNICDTLVNRFGAYEGLSTLKQEKVTLEGTAKIWYITRFMDGFIIDSNIPGVRELVYGKNEAKGSVLSYRPTTNDMIQAAYYAIPDLVYGQWAAFVTSSTFAYGAAGKAGRTNTSTSYDESDDYQNYYNYLNRYYGAGGYYDDMYGNYYNNSALNWNTGVSGVVKTNILTEIPSFSPLLFQIYIEPKEQ